MTQIGWPSKFEGSVVEYRIPMPFSLEEFRVGHVFMVGKSAADMEGVRCDLLSRSESVRGLRYFRRRFHVLDRSRWPQWVRSLLGYMRVTDALTVEEETWDEFPRLRTVYSVPLLGSRATVEVRTVFVAEDRGYTENVHRLPTALLEKRRVERIDILTDSLEPHYNDQGACSDDVVRRFRPRTAHREPLRPRWAASSRTEPVMCAYKVVLSDLRFWGLAKKLDAGAHHVLRQLYLRSHRQAYLWMDDWLPLSYDAVREWEQSLHSKRPSPVHSNDSSVTKSLSKKESKSSTQESSSKSLRSKL